MIISQARAPVFRPSAQTPIRVGIVGASADPFQWGSTAHVPALRALPEYEIVAVAATNQASADAAAAQHSIPRSYGRYADMLAANDIDLVCVITSVMHHRALATAAITAGKHVFCEWPLGVATAEAIDLRDRAIARGVRTLVGLQNRYAPAILRAHELIAEGYVGVVRSVNMTRANDQMARMAMPASWTYFLDRRQANSGLTILAGHALDTLAACVGELRDLQAYTEVLMPEVTIVETGEPFTITAPDHILVQGRLSNGAVVTSHMKMNSPIADAFRIEISGSRGALIISSSERLRPETRQPGIPSDLVLSGTPDFTQGFKPVPLVDDVELIPAAVPNGQPQNVAAMYRRFSCSFTEDVEVAGFSHGVMRHLLLDTIQSAADTGRRVRFGQGYAGP